jgi:hypothetical protein
MAAAGLISLAKVMNGLNHLSMTRQLVTLKVSKMEPLALKSQ